MRDFYIIYKTTDHEGYYTDIIYMGDSLKEATRRYLFAFNKIIETDYDYTIPEELEIEYNEPFSHNHDYTYSYITDEDNYYYTSLVIQKIKKNKYYSERLENQYNQTYPFAKK